MALDLNKLKTALDEHKNDIQAAKDMEVAKLAQNIKQWFKLDDILSKFNDSEKAFLGKIASIRDEYLQKMITDLMKEHEQEDQLYIRFSLIVPKLCIKIKRFDHEPNIFDYSYVRGFLLLDDYGHGISDQYIQSHSDSISVNKQFSVLDKVFEGFCKTILDFNFIRTLPYTYSDTEHEAKFNYDYEIFVDAISNRLSEFELKIIDTAINYDNNSDDDLYILHFKVKNPLLNN